MWSWENLWASGWVCPTAMLCTYGFFANCRPAEPFLTPYLVGSKNISEDVVTNYLFPIWTYSYLALLFPVFLLTDLLRYKPLIVLQGLFLVTNYSLLCFADDLAAMTVLQVNYAVVTSTEVAYFSCIYRLIPPQHYQRATGCLRGAMLSGYTLGAASGQLLVSLAGVSYFHINTITLALVAIAFLVSFFVPMPQHGMFFHQGGLEMDGQDIQETAEAVEPKVARHKSGKKEEMRGAFGVQHAGLLLWSSAREAYSSRGLAYWSLWWAMATAGYNQVFNYVQLMWDHVEPSSSALVYNGGVEAVCTLVGAAAAFAVGHVRVRWEVWGELSLGVFSAVGAGAVFLMALSSNIWLCYAGYVIFKASYMLQITVTTFQIAASLSMQCYALTFGINTFVAITLQTVITAVVVDESTLGLDIVTQFVIYGSYHACISVLFLIRGLYTAWNLHSRSKHAEPQSHVLSARL
ncbi:solute carrier family 19 member 3b [Denticeps clupeoides]|uniref:Solute carrier family 19 member 3b n=1 Tax=Denticeps clupeoides TaxID=299321 RepID=A0AAY4C8J2_9TELE|nr:thiamine transporter 2-like [Denticeps clupeoides]